MVEFTIYDSPREGERIGAEKGVLSVPDMPIIPIIKGDGIGPEITDAGKKVIDAVVERAYAGKKRIVWFDLSAGEEAFREHREYLPEDTEKAIRHFLVAIKGPLTTPVGGGHRSLNVTLRQGLDLYCCVRPVRYFQGVPAPMKNPEKLNVVIFRENTEDVYAGIEWKANSEEAKKAITFLNEMGKSVREDSGIGIKPISSYGSKRLVRAAIEYALKNNRKSVTMMHKGNIMKFTEGAFRAWGYEVAKKEFPNKTVTEQELFEKFNGSIPEKRIVIKDRIADAMFQEVLLRPEQYDVIAAPNLNGDYISDACAAQVGGLGIAPGANINYDKGNAVFEATHGTAPDIAGKDLANPLSFILSGSMMLEYLGWTEASEKIERAIEKTIKAKTVTSDLASKMEGAKGMKCSEFGEAIIKNIE